MSKRFVLVVAALVAALIGYIAVFERGSLSSKEIDERKGRVLSAFVRDHITRLALSRDGKTLVLERKLEDDGTFSPWKLTAPLKAEADQESVDRLLGELEWLSARRILEHVAAGDLKKLGLEKSRFQLTYRVSGDEHGFRVGGSDAHGDNYYAAVDGEDTVYVVPKTVVEALDHELGHFRAKEFLGDITSAWAERLTLTQQTRTTALQKRDGKWWVLSEPSGYADERRVKELVDKLDGLRAVRFLEGAAKTEAQRALASAQRSVDLRVIPDVHREDKVPQRFLLRLGPACAGHDGERYAQAGEHGDPVCVRAEDVERFDAAPEDLRLTRLFGADPSEIESIELEAAGTRWKLKRNGEKWSAEGLAPPDRDAVEAWLRDVSEVRATSFGPKQALSAGLTLRLTLASQAKSLLSVDFGDGKELRVQRDDEPVIVSFPAQLGDRLRPFAGRFLSLSLWPDRQPSQVLSLSARDGARARKLVSDAGVFRAAKGAAAVPDAERVRELVRALVKLSAISVVSDRARPEHGLDHAHAGLTLSLSEGAPLTLELGAKSERGVFARVDGARVVELEAHAADMLAELASGQRVVSAAGEDAGAGEGHEDEDAHEDEDDHAHDHAHE